MLGKVIGDSVQRTSNIDKACNHQYDRKWTDTQVVEKADETMNLWNMDLQG